MVWSHRGTERTSEAWAEATTRAMHGPHNMLHGSTIYDVWVAAGVELDWALPSAPARATHARQRRGQAGSFAARQTADTKEQQYRNVVVLR